MRVGLLGNVGEHGSQLEAIARFFLQIVRAEHVLYLGGDSALTEFVARAKASLLGTSDSTLCQRTLRCLSASPEEIDEFLEVEDQLCRLGQLESVPAQTVRTLHLSRGQSVAVSVHRADLSEEVSGGAGVVAFGSELLPLVKQVGPRFILCPGSLTKAGLMVLDDDDDGMRISLFDRYGKQIAQHALSRDAQN
ncbi:MAG: hypothetical protein RJA70_4725 [Pseudomonadota bacterium]|jgi:hypothetical protein